MYSTKHSEAKNILQLTLNLIFVMNVRKCKVKDAYTPIQIPHNDVTPVSCSEESNLRANVMQVLGNIVRRTPSVRCTCLFGTNYALQLYYFLMRFIAPYGDYRPTCKSFNGTAACERVSRERHHLFAKRDS